MPKGEYGILLENTCPVDSLKHEIIYYKCKKLISLSILNPNMNLGERTGI